MLIFLIPLRALKLGRMAGLAMPLGLFAAHALATSGLFPPPAPPDYRTFYMAVAGGLLAAVFDGLRAGAVARRFLIVLWPLAVIAAVAGRRLAIERADDPLLLAGLCAVGIAVFLRLDRAREREADAPVMLAASCGFAALAAVAWGITGLVMPFAATGAMALAFAALSFGRLPRPFTLAAIVTGGSIWLGLNATLVLHAGLSRIAFLLLALPFAADLVWRGPASGRMRWLRAAVIGLAAGIPGAAAVFHSLP